MWNFSTPVTWRNSAFSPSIMWIGFTRYCAEKSWAKNWARREKVQKLVFSDALAVHSWHFCIWHCWSCSERWQYWHCCHCHCWHCVHWCWHCWPCRVYIVDTKIIDTVGIANIVDIVNNVDNIDIVATLIGKILWVLYEKICGIFLLKRKVYFADIPFISSWTYVLRQNRLTPLYSKANTELNPPSPPFLFQTLKCQDYFHGICREIYSTGFHRYVFTNKSFCRCAFFSRFFCVPNSFAGVCMSFAGVCETCVPNYVFTGVCEIWTATKPTNHRFHRSWCERHSQGSIKTFKNQPRASELMKSWVSGLWQGLFNNAQRLLHCQVVWLKVKANVYNFFHKRTDFSIKIDITLWFCLFSKTTNSFGF